MVVINEIMDLMRAYQLYNRSLADAIHLLQQIGQRDANHASSRKTTQITRCTCPIINLRVAIIVYA